jgi:hypothetical protein
LKKTHTGVQGAPIQHRCCTQLAMSFRHRGPLPVLVLRLQMPFAAVLRQTLLSQFRDRLCPPASCAFLAAVVGEIPGVVAMAAVVCPPEMTHVEAVSHEKTASGEGDEALASDRRKKQAPEMAAAEFARC